MNGVERRHSLTPNNVDPNDTRGKSGIPTTRATIRQGPTRVRRERSVAKSCFG